MSFRRNELDAPERRGFFAGAAKRVREFQEGRRTKAVTRGSVESLEAHLAVVTPKPKASRYPHKREKIGPLKMARWMSIVESGGRKVYQLKTSSNMFLNFKNQ